jgi:hypothetical protein
MRGILITLLLILSSTAFSANEIRCEIQETYSSAEGIKWEMKDFTLTFSKRSHPSYKSPNLAEGIIELSEGYEIVYSFKKSHLTDDITFEPYDHYVGVQLRLQRRDNFQGVVTIMDEFTRQYDAESAPRVNMRSGPLKNFTLFSEWLQKVDWDLSQPPTYKEDDALGKGMRESKIPPGLYFKFYVSCTIRVK